MGPAIAHMAKRALDFGVASMADQDDRSALPPMAFDFSVDFRNQRANRVERNQIPSSGLWQRPAIRHVRRKSRPIA